MRVSDWIAQFVRSKGVEHVFGVVGGGAIYLNDSFRDSFIPCHGEQAAAFAADAYGRLRGLGCCLVTTGPGGTNAITGVACAWTDSTPVLVISGQVTTQQVRERKERHAGVQGLPQIIEMVRPITVYARMVWAAEEVEQTFRKACEVAVAERGPVWIDVPLDVQGAQCAP